MTDAPLYDYSIVPFTNGMKNLLHCMDKAEQYAKEKGENVEDYLQLRIHPDMQTFTYQIQRISDQAKFTFLRVIDADPGPYAMEDNEKTWAELRTRLEKTINVLEAHAKPEDFVGREDKQIDVMGRFKFSAKVYLQMSAVPNFYFHFTTAYDLLRMQGVPVGKMDFLTGGRALPS